MKVIVDLNLIIDVLQRREPFFMAAAKVCDVIKNGKCEGIVAAHAVTTLFYIIRKCTDLTTAKQALDWLMSTFEVAYADKSIFVTARSMEFSDFEDAVVSASAAANSCNYIVTRNLGDFRRSRVKAITPEEFLSLVEQQRSERRFCFTKTD